MSLTYTCLIVDDEPLAQELIAEYVSKIPELTVIGTCSNALEASSLITKEKVDLLFLDINMPVIKGIDFFKNLVDRPQVIFTTAYREYALEGFEVSAVDYLLKPIVFERFFLAIQKFFKVAEKKGSTLESKSDGVEMKDILFVSQGHRKIKVDLHEVRYIESFKDYIKIHGNQGELKIKENIGEFEKKLRSNFLRIHRSYIINTEYLTGFSKHDVEINEQELPIGSSYGEKVSEFLKSKYFSQQERSGR
ncbi:MAG: LytTR family DNA-binding domain-containing protein [Bacteroidota bacterium]